MGAARGARHGYGAGQERESIGGWYNSVPWKNASMFAYIDEVKRHLSQRT